MHFNENYFRKHPSIQINRKIQADELMVKQSINVRDVTDVFLKGSIEYDWNLRKILVDCQITGNVIVECARTLTHFAHPIDINWTDEYVFVAPSSANVNFINDPEGFDVDNYAFDAINMNIPINLSNKNGTIFTSGSSYQVMSEDEYNRHEDEQVDPRWAKLASLVNSENQDK